MTLIFYFIVNDALSDHSKKKLETKKLDNQNDNIALAKVETIYFKNNRLHRCYCLLLLQKS